MTTAISIHPLPYRSILPWLRSDRLIVYFISLIGRVYERDVRYLALLDRIDLLEVSLDLFSKYYPPKYS